ncbi:uncharacterized protein [Nicotiana tomentosiformis]|uniref:uncharacterized protein n=1 Tax=Nicotiana tomentosiformis TaxID=4098 RepID=UPI00388C56DF
MEMTRATGQDVQPPVPPARAARGRGCSRGHGRGGGAACTAAGAAPVDPPVALAQEQVSYVVEPVGPAQALAGPIMIPGLQKALAQILTMCTNLARAVSVQTAPTTFQVGGGTQTPVARIPEQVWKLQPPSFNGAESEDAQDILDRCQRILRTAGILETIGVSFTIFQFTRAAFRWWEAYERSMPVGATPLSWNEFSVIFLEKFVPPTRREELCRQFEQLRQDGLSVAQYKMRFLELSHHTVWLVPTERERIRRFIGGLTHHLRFAMTRGSVSAARFDEVVDIARRLEVVHSQECGERESKRPRGSGGFIGVSSGGSVLPQQGSSL